MTKETVFKLKHTVEVDGQHYDSLSIRRPKGRDFGLLPAGNAQRLADLYPFVAAICNVDVTVIEALDFEDVNALMQKTPHFFA